MKSENKMVKREEKSLRILIAVGINDDLAKKLLKKGYTKSKLQKVSKKELMKTFPDEDIDSIKEKVDRIPISNETIERLMVECDWKCCVCPDITKSQPVIIHHITEYALTQDNSFDN